MASELLLGTHPHIRIDFDFTGTKIKPFKSFIQITTKSGSWLLLFAKKRG